MMVRKEEASVPLAPSPGRAGRTAEGDHGSRAKHILGSRPEAQAQRTSFNSKKKKGVE